MKGVKRYTSKSKDDFFTKLNIGDRFYYSAFWGYVVEAALSKGVLIEKKGFEMGVVVEKREIKESHPIAIDEQVVVPEHLKKRKRLLKEERPDIFRQLHLTKNEDVNLDELSVSSNIRVWWLCDNSHEWETAVGSRTTAAKGNCPYCLRDREISGKNFTKTHPVLTKFWNKNDNGNHRPETSTTRDGIRINFTCDKGHEFSRMLFNKLPDCCPKCKVKNNNPLRSLNGQEASLVKKLYRDGFKKIDISEKTGFSYKVVDNIISGRTYKDID